MVHMRRQTFKKIFYQSSDYETALAIRRRVFIEEQKVPENIEIDEFECNSHHFLVSEDGVPLATGRLRIVGQKIKFERIATLAEARNQGLGKFMITKMANFAETNYPELTPYMHSQESAVGFYEKLGWKKLGDIFYEANIPHFAMTKNPQAL